jgi:hypothetical protein
MRGESKTHFGCLGVEIIVAEDINGDPLKQGSLDRVDTLKFDGK